MSDSGGAAAERRQLSVTSLTSADMEPPLQQVPSCRGDSPGASRQQRRSTVPLVLQDARNGCPGSAQLLKHQKVCRYCLSVFDDETNRKGDCREAPDRVRGWIEKLTCFVMADAALYHCCADDDGDYLAPCQLRARSYDATTSDEDDEQPTAVGVGHKLRAWTCVCLLTACLPCLCCFPLCSLAHRVGKRLHWLGPRHSPLEVKKDATRNTIAGIESEHNACTV